MRRTISLLALVLLVVAGTGHTRAARPKYGPAILGATLADWIHQFGPYMSNTDADIAGWRPCPHDAKGAQLLVSFADKRADSINASPCEGSRTPTISHNAGAARLFMPADARREGVTKSDQGTGTVYFSASLAKIHLPASTLVDCDGNPVKRGLFTLNLDSGGDGTWTLNIGVCA